jgi:hypothetical protein
MIPKLPKKLQGSILLSILFLSISISSTAQLPNILKALLQAQHPLPVTHNRLL